jgi:plasmid stability protein
MTKMVQIRNVPDDMHRELRSRAAKAGMSLSDYLRQELERLVSRPPMAEVLGRADARSSGLTTAEVVAAVRADRDSR